MKSANKTKTSSKSKGRKSASKNKTKTVDLEKLKKKEEQYKKLEDYLNESGLTLAFNIIFAELISKQILPENFFAYTSMRLKQFAKEIENVKTKEIVYIDKPKEEEEKENLGVKVDDDVFLTAQGIKSVEQKETPETKPTTTTNKKK